MNHASPRRRRKLLRACLASLCACAVGALSMPQSALGATPAGIVSMVFMRVVLLVGTGVVAGVGLALWLATFVRSLLHNVEPSDPVTMVGAAAALAVTGGLAALVPAWRAARTDPATVLREQ